MIIKIKDYLLRVIAGKNVERVLVVLSTIYLFCVFLNIALTTPFVYDSALHAIFSKNFANGYGWAESYHGKVAFWVFTTGPVVMLPGALSIYILGNKIWVPGLTVCLLNFSILALFALQMREIVSTKNTYYSFLAGMIFFFLLYENYWWGYFIGEISSFLLLLVACACLSGIDGHNVKKRLFLFGIIFSLSIDAKVIAIPGFAGMLILLFAIVTCSAPFRQQSFIEKVKLLSLSLSGFILTQIPFRLFEIINLWLDGRYNYWEYLTFRHALFATRSFSGIPDHFTVAQLFSAFAENPVYEYKQLLKIFISYGFPWPVLAISMLFLIAFTVVGLKKFQAKEKKFLMFLAAAFGFYLIWFFLFAHIIYDRTAIHVILLFLVYVAYLVSRIFGWKGILSLILVVLVFVAPVKKEYFFKTIALTDPSGGDNTLYNKSIIDMRDFVLNNPPRLPLSNCGWMGATREIEFLLPQSDNFKNCYRLIREALALNPSGGGYHWTHPVNFTLMVNNVSWAMSKGLENNKKTQPIIMHACKQNMLYENSLFRLMECPFESLEKYIPLDADTPFMSSPGFIEGFVNNPALFKYPEN